MQVEQKINDKLIEINKETQKRFLIYNMLFNGEIEKYLNEQLAFNKKIYQDVCHKINNKYKYQNINNIEELKKYLIFLKNNHAISERWYEFYNHQMHNEKTSNKQLIEDFNRFIQQQIEEEIYNEYFHTIDSIRTKIIKELLAKLTRVERILKKIDTVKQMFGSFWDLSNNGLNQMSEEFLTKWERLVEEKVFLQKISELLGRLANAQKEYEDVLIKQRILIPSTKRSYYSPTNITAVSFGNELHNILKYQLALRKKLNTKKIFDVNFMEKKLLQLEQSEKRFDEIQIEKIQKQLKQNKGPFILCIDTSASMYNQPETIAKAFALCILKIALKEKRKCYIITFSDRIEEFDASNVHRDLKQLYLFLSKSFLGGTDIEPTLIRACQKCQESDYSNGDVLVISDFIVPPIHDDLLQTINELKSKNIRFNALSIGKSQITQNISYFDNNWIYDGTQASIKKIINDLNRMNDKLKQESN